MFKATQERILERPLEWREVNEDHLTIALADGPDTADYTQQLQNTSGVVTEFYEKLFSPETQYDPDTARVSWIGQ